MQGPMYILPPGLSHDLSVAIGAPPGLPPPPCPGDVLRAFARADVDSVGDSCAAPQPWRPDSLFTRPSLSESTRCSTDEPATPPSPPTPPTPESIELFAGAHAAAKSLLQFLGHRFEDAASEEGWVTQWGLEADEELLPILWELVSQDKKRSKAKDKVGNCVRWWAKPTSPLLCPLSGFPTCLLPYPPFKLRVDPSRATPHCLVDGKFLALRCIVTGQYAACGRELQETDIIALDEYVHRCKLGPFRPSRALDLQTAASHGDQKAAEDLKRLLAAAHAELGKLKRIQENRFGQILQEAQWHATLKR
ncbi:unnamed protein product [Effrenium voratum]|nr:unnamed protein product [Effrenium voratum]|mmetsp:Transcript_100989/g.240662  ORF Transcript_100989/g.240662 Transcript_100989/m.240662 type:complete len:306 (+) Transcript_100989:72-989(+)